jgi:GDPmannose 4,6-dehydratase
MKRTALVSGVGGQDGSYLVELLLGKGYEVHGFDVDDGSLRRLTETLSTREDRDNVVLHHADVTSPSEMSRLVSTVQPAEVYNLAAQTRVDISFVEPLATVQSITIGTINLLEAIRKIHPSCRFFQASSSEMFGNTEAPQREDSPLAPISPYGCAKVLAHHLVTTYRQAYGIWAVAGILFNHESERRSEDFVSRKITKAVAEIVAGKRTSVALGNLHTRRDWGHARDYVDAMWRIMRQPQPREYVIASGHNYSVADFAEMAFSLTGLDWADHVVSDPQLIRPTDPSDLLGDASRARLDLGWEPATSFPQLVRGMLASDLLACGVDLGRLQPHGSRPT